jgi:hypothetical protein
MTDDYVIFMPYSLSINSPRALLCFLFIFGTDGNDLIGQIPTELQTLPLSFCALGECRAFSLPFPFVLRLQGLSHTLAIVIIHIVGNNCFDTPVATINICTTSFNCG